MVSKIITGTLSGISAYLVLVEIDISKGLPGFSMVGSLGSEVREAKERVLVALKNVGINIPPLKITVNLSPGDKRKDGTAFDLPIALAILTALGMIPEEDVADTMFVGELGLLGQVRRVKGILPLCLEAARCGIKRCVIPMENIEEGRVVDSVKVQGINNIMDILEGLREEPDTNSNLELAEISNEPELDFSQVGGQENAKRAAEIAVAGFHNLLMFGPPGAGKSMIAKRIPGIMPLLSYKESLEVTSIYSVAGLLGKNQSLIVKRPFQSPHHSISTSALCGGMSIPKPGVISLAHRGVLFLDELPEFKRETIESLRQPVENKKITVSRLHGSVEYPADFMLVCAMNPCPCGYFPDRNRCRCTEPEITRYLNKISGPILDRIDLSVDMKSVDVATLKNNYKSESSETIRNRIMKARQLQKERFKGSNLMFNGDMEASDINIFCRLGKKEEELLEKLYKSLGLSARGYHRILRISRTIADLSEEEEIREEHIMEAACFRSNIGGEEK